MERLTKLICVTFAVALLAAPAAFADTTVNFSDTHKYWLQGEGTTIDWHNNSTSFGYVDDNLDVIGTPNFQNGSLTINSANRLSGISISYTNGSTLEKIGDLFLDLNADNYWDYVVKLYNPSGPSAGAGNYGMYSVHIDARKNSTDFNATTHTDTRYYLSGQDNTGEWAGYVIRDDSPFAAKGLVGSSQSVGFSGWSTASGLNTSTFTFGASSLDLTGSSQMILAWDPNCANDVLWEKVSLPPTSTPESSTVILLGGGLLGLFVSRKRLIEQMQS